MFWAFLRYNETPPDTQNCWVQMSEKMTWAWLWPEMSSLIIHKILVKIKCANSNKNSDEKYFSLI